MSSPKSPTLKVRFEERQSRAVADAARVLAARGYDQTSVPELAGAIGLAAGGLYHYFESKEQLLIRICDELMEPLLQRASAVVEENEGDPTGQLRELVRVWVAHVAEHRDHMLVFQQERHVIEHGSQWKHVRAARKDFERLLDRVLAAVERVERARLADRRIALAALLGMVNHTAQWYRQGGRLTPRRLADGYLELILS